MFAHNRFLVVTYSTIRLAFRLYFEPLLWIGKGFYQALAESRVRKKGGKILHSPRDGRNCGR